RSTMHAGEWGPGSGGRSTLRITPSRALPPQAPTRRADTLGVTGVASRPVIHRGPLLRERPVRPSSPMLSILIPDGESHFALSVVTCLGLGPRVRVHVVSSDPSARVRHSRYCASSEAVPGGGDEAERRAIP